MVKANRERLIALLKQAIRDLEEGKTIEPFGAITAAYRMLGEAMGRL